MAQYLKDLFAEWEAECDDRFNQVKANEEELNRIFIDIYGLQDELTPEVDDKDVTVRKADLDREIRSLISYGVGCMFGRYSLEEEGLQFAGGDWETEQTGAARCRTSRLVDKDGIIPVIDEERWFADDIVVQFRQFLSAAFGEASLTENLAFIERVLGKDIRKYFVKDFYKDHIQRYQKRPIYWLFSSPKGSFQALIYLHRYTPDLPGMVLNDYVRRFAASLTDERNHCESEIARLAGDGDNAESARHRAQLSQQVLQLSAQIDDVTAYDRETLYHLAIAKPVLDLDDGVKVNYQKLGAALKDIGLAKKEKNK